MSHPRWTVPKPSRRVVTAAALAVAAAVGWQASAWQVSAAAQGPSSGVSVKLQHVVLTATGERLAVLEMWNMENPGSHPADLEVTLPAGAADLVVREGSKERPVEFKRTATGFRLPDWVEPGERLVSFSYTLALKDGTALRWARTAAYPVEELVVVVEDGKLEVLPGSLRALGSTELAGRRFRLFGATGLKPGDRVAFDVSPVAPAGQAAEGGGANAEGAAHPEEQVITTSLHGGNANVELWQRTTGLRGHGGLFGVFLMSVFGVAAPYGGLKLAARRRAHSEAPSPGVSDTGRRAALQEEKQRLIRQIADLDRRRAAGAIDEASYTESRERLKRRLVEVTRQLRGT